MIIVTGQRNEKHVTSWQARTLNQGMFGEGSYVLDIGQKMEAEAYSSNEIRIRDGALVHQGCLSVIQKGTYDAVTIQNGTQDMKRIDLIVARYTKNTETQVEDMEWVVIQGTPDASSPSVPAYTDGDIQGGDLTVDMPVYQVLLNGIHIEEITAVFEEAPSLYGLKGKVQELNDDLNACGIYERISDTTISYGNPQNLAMHNTKRSGAPYFSFNGGSIKVNQKCIALLCATAVVDHDNPSGNAIDSGMCTCGFSLDGGSSANGNLTSYAFGPSSNIDHRINLATVAQLSEGAEITIRISAQAYSGGSQSQIVVSAVYLEIVMLRVED